MTAATLTSFAAPREAHRPLSGARADDGRHARLAAPRSSWPLAGCMVGPDYTRPPVDAPTAFIYEPKDAADTANTRGGSSSTTRCSTSSSPRRSPTTSTSRSRRPTSSRRPACSRRRARRCSRRSATTAPAGACAQPSPPRRPSSRAHSESAVVLPGAAERELGDRPVGPHPAPERIGARQPARNRRSAARRDPVARVVGREQLPHAARPRRAARDREAARSATYGESVRLYQLQFQYGQVVADDTSRRRNRSTRPRPCRSRRSSRRSRRPRMRCRCCSAATRGRFRAASRSTISRCRRCPPGVPSELLDAPPRSPAGRGHADRGQRADRRRARAVLPDDLAHRRVRRRRARSCRTCSPAPRACGTTPASSSGRSSRSAP